MCIHKLEVTKHSGEILVPNASPRGALKCLDIAPPQQQASLRSFPAEPTLHQLPHHRDRLAPTPRAASTAPTHTTSGNFLYFSKLTHKVGIISLIRNDKIMAIGLFEFFLFFLKSVLVNHVFLKSVPFKKISNIWV